MHYQVKYWLIYVYVYVLFGNIIQVLPNLGNVELIGLLLENTMCLKTTTFSPPVMVTCSYKMPDREAIHVLSVCWISSHIRKTYVPFHLISFIAQIHVEECTSNVNCELR